MCMYVKEGLYMTFIKKHRSVKLLDVKTAILWSFIKQPCFLFCVYNIYVSWRCVLNTTLCDKVCQWLATGRWFSLVFDIKSFLPSVFIKYIYFFFYSQKYKMRYFLILFCIFIIFILHVWLWFSPGTLVSLPINLTTTI